MTFEAREDAMARMYGEVCTKAAAARILNCAAGTIYNMLEDGRLEPACGGRMVDVRSIARYIAQPAQEETEARKRRMMQRNGSQFAV